MAVGKIEAVLALRGQGAGPIGRDRIAMLEAVAQPMVSQSWMF